MTKEYTTPRTGKTFIDLNYEQYPWADTRGDSAVSRKARGEFLSKMKKLWYENDVEGILFLNVKRDQHHPSRLNEALGRMQKANITNILHLR